VRVSYDATRLSQATQAFAHKLPDALHSDAAAILEALLETVRRNRCITRPGNVSLTDKHIWGDFLRRNLYVSVYAKSRRIWLIFAGCRRPRTQADPIKPSQPLIGLLAGKGGGPLLSAAFDALRTASLIVADRGAFVIDSRHLVFTDGRRSPLCRCRKCDGAIPNSQSHCAAFKCDGTLELLADEARRTRRIVDIIFRLYLGADGHYAAKVVREHMRQFITACARRWSGTSSAGRSAC